MNIDHDIGVILQKCMNKLSKIQQRDVQVAIELRKLTEKELYYRQSVIETRKILMEVLKQKKENEDNIIEMVKLLEENTQKLICLKRNKKITIKRIAKYNRQLKIFNDLPDGIDLVTDDKNIFHKKFLKSTRPGRILRLFIDNNPPKNVCRGFIGDPRKVSVNPFEFELQSHAEEEPLSDRLWKHIEQCSDVMESYERLILL